MTSSKTDFLSNFDVDSHPQKNCWESKMESSESSKVCVFSRLIIINFNLDNFNSSEMLTNLRKTNSMFLARPKIFNTSLHSSPYNNFWHLRYSIQVSFKLTCTISQSSQVVTSGTIFSLSFFFLLINTVWIHNKSPFGCRTVIIACFPGGTSCCKNRKNNHKRLRFKLYSGSFIQNKN